MSEILVHGMEKIGIPCDIIEKSVPLLEKYINEIILYNSAYNLTNTSEHDELVVRHILDSLAAYPELADLVSKNGGNSDSPFIIADIGSGGGFPGIPLAMVFPQVEFRLVERMSKRCAFLENCAALFGLKNVQVINSEAERLEEAFADIAVFRAFRPLDKKMTKTLLRIIKKDGYLAAYKAKEESITAEMEEIKTIVPEYIVKKLDVPGLEDSERNLVLIKK